MIYVIDTSALIDAWTKWYPPNNFPTIWENIEDLGRNNILTIPDAVILELSAQDDDLYKWCKARNNYICTSSTEPRQKIIITVSNKYKNLIKSGTPSRNFADPIVISIAEYFQCTVVTHEKFTGDLNGPRIPDVCKDMGIRVVQFHQVVQEQRW